MWEIFMVKIRSFCLVFFLTAATGGSAGAQVILQSFDDAMRSDMYEPAYQDSRVIPKEKKASEGREHVIAVSGNQAGDDDYNKKIAARLFNLDLSEKSEANIRLKRKKQEFRVAPGQVLNIIITTDPDNIWLFNKNSELLEYVSTESGKDKLTIRFLVKKEGTEKLYFDAIKKNKGKVEVLEARILKLTSEARRR